MPEPKVLKVHFETTTSTMDEAKNFIKSNNEDFENLDLLVITAAEQTAGKGQFAKVWASPKGAGIYVSLVKKYSGEALNEDRVAFLLNESAMLVHGCLKKFLAGFDVVDETKLKIKAPNDVYFDGGKLAGTLVEVVKGAKFTFLVYGVGINLKDVPRQIKEAHASKPKAAPISLEEILNCSSVEKLAIEPILDDLAAEILK